VVVASSGIRVPNLARGMTALDLAARLRKPLNRKVSLRDSFLKKLRQEGTRTLYKRNGALKRKRPLKKVARARRTQLQAYQALAEAFLSLPENRLCVICQTRREHGENILVNLATEVHHHRGRRGRLLCWLPGFRPSCYHCRMWPHDHPKTAREYGLLAPAPLWDCLPVDGTNGN
jgi:hypothetical protein